MYLFFPFLFLNIALLWGDFKLPVHGELLTFMHVTLSLCPVFLCIITMSIISHMVYLFSVLDVCV